MPTIEFEGGRTLSSHIEYTLGNIENRLSVAQLKTKFVDEVLLQIGQKRAERAYETYNSYPVVGSSVGKDRLSSGPNVMNGIFVEKPKEASMKDGPASMVMIRGSVVLEDGSVEPVVLPPGAVVDVTGSVEEAAWLELLGVLRVWIESED
ncbi:hypothetical protein GGR58DRAFT_496801 [Xylaria digitata]|nr:hypothetical protein GGR58DRAFT_496801 [Xylaria digitata]